MTAKYQHYSYYGYKNMALGKKKKGNSPKLGFWYVKYMFAVKNFFCGTAFIGRSSGAFVPSFKYNLGH